MSNGDTGLETRIIGALDKEISILYARLILETQFFHCEQMKNCRQVCRRKSSPSDFKKKRKNPWKATTFYSRRTVIRRTRTDGNLTGLTNGILKKIGEIALCVSIFIMKSSFETHFYSDLWNKTLTELESGSKVLCAYTSFSRDKLKSYTLNTETQ